MRILLLAGTSEARDLAHALVERGHQVTASLVGATRAPRDLGCETRIGGFGGEQGFRDWLAAHPVDLVIDATHPFAVQITDRTARVCAEVGLEHLQLRRDPWVPADGDNWTFIDHPAQAESVIQAGSKVFLATGRQTLEQFAGLSSCTLICRQIDPPEGPFPFENGEFLVGRPPFSIEDEVQLFTNLKIDWLVVKNAGGVMSRSKLDAARQIGLPVLMINRTTPPDGPIVTSVDAALEWLNAHYQG
ncbi:precorrin-6A/cobalt-precorrin-6A reductase [Litoreibacter halocynthiae]|uniref:Precorrin-6A/cobalt-precorrin-6A reductase n=1 Tax=Litoreibacter halocynthiae TaxID=1242689 RepID=A0A4R7LQ16_9RHOB|nr:cobalt-precorrin-6A reductase [Litoreibacter halocynthiae]TDT77894.1 precorrin-6A/cobalt-precorrin-6A reductase [Litoreibacter halocynthiae]